MRSDAGEHSLTTRQERRHTRQVHESSAELLVEAGLVQTANLKSLLPEADELELVAIAVASVYPKFGS